MRAGTKPPTSEERKKKNLVGTGASFFSHHRKTHKRKLGAFFSPREHTTSKCQRAEPLPGLMWNDIPAAMHHPPVEVGGEGGFTWTAARCEVHLCEGSCRVLAPLPRGGDGSLTGAAASTNQLPIRCTHTRKQTHTYTEASMTTRILLRMMCSRTLSLYFHIFINTFLRGDFAERDLLQGV